MDPSRRKLLFASAGGGALATIGACGGSDSPPPASNTPPSPAPLTCGATAISANHGHVLTIPAADLDSMVQITYSIEGMAGHVHTVTLSSAQLAQIKAKSAVMVTSTLGGGGPHSHDVVVNCV